jgi:hypothetical protein
VQTVHTYDASDGVRVDSGVWICVGGHAHEVGLRRGAEVGVVHGGRWLLSAGSVSSGARGERRVVLWSGSALAVCI